MVTLNCAAVASPLGAVRTLAVVCTCISFSLVASLGHFAFSFWAWCMFSWCFCFSVSLLILLLELLTLNEWLPVSWGDFTAAFSLLATLMLLASSVIYPMFFSCLSCGREIAASVTSWLAFVSYAYEVGLTRARPGDVASEFLSTPPGLLKVLEAFVACVVFICLEKAGYANRPALQWCLVVYSVCFIFSLLIILAAVCRALTRFPSMFSKVLMFGNVLAVLMYLTVAIIWPIYNFSNNPRPAWCPRLAVCVWDALVAVAVMTFFNLVTYSVDTVYSFRLIYV